MSRLNSLAFFLISLTLIVATIVYGAVHWPAIALFYIAMALLVLILMTDSFLSGTLRVSCSLLQAPLVALGIYGLIQVIPFGTSTGSDGIPVIPRTISIYPFTTEASTLHIFALCIFFAATLVCLNSAARIRRFASVLLVFGFVYAFYAILQSVLSPTRIYGIYEAQNAMPFGSLVNRHQFAAFMEMAAAIPLGLLFTGAVRRDKRLLYIVAAVLIGSALLLSGSRGGMISFLCEIILLIMLTAESGARKSTLLRAGLSVTLLAAIVGGAIFVGGDTSLTRFAETASSKDITSNRLHIWAVTLRVIVAYLPFGTGLGAYQQAYTKFDTLSGLEQVEQAHNDYLQIVADAGIVGLIIGGAFLFLFFKEGIRNSRRHNTFRRGIAIGAFVGCTAVLIHSLFDFVLHTTAVSLMFLALMAMMITAGRQYKDDVTEFDKQDRKHHRSGSVTSIRSGRP
jgi:O-antigen ligase